MIILANSMTIVLLKKKLKSHRKNKRERKERLKTSFRGA